MLAGSSLDYNSFVPTELIAERKKNNLPYDDLMEEEATESGIKGWYLDAPAWAEGIKKGKGGHR